LVAETELFGRNQSASAALAGDGATSPRIRVVLRCRIANVYGERLTSDTAARVTPNDPMPAPDPIIRVAHVTGLGAGFEFVSAHAASKFGLEGFMESLRAEVASNRSLSTSLDFDGGASPG
jgi:NAD(P)-dependent dehydrogenase (short-subunit alcohol dehydrogenase family)